MDGDGYTRSGIDHAIAKLARRQHGVVTRRQLAALGVGRGAVDRRLSRGRLHSVHRGVYLVGHSVAPPHALEMAALLALGSHAVLGHRSAAKLWDLLPYPATAQVCVTVPPGHSRKRRGLRISHSALPPRDIRARHGLRLTSPPRTILDLAPGLDRYELERLIAEARYRRLATEAELDDQLGRNPGRPGTPAIRDILGLPTGPRRTRSPRERDLLRLLDTAGIDGYETNAQIHGYEVDLLWRSEGLVVELDGYDGHAGRVAFERDRVKAATLEGQGLIVMPITPRRVRDDPDGVLRRLEGVLATRRADSAETLPR